MGQTCTPQILRDILEDVLDCRRRRFEITAPATTALLARAVSHESFVGISKHKEVDRINLNLIVFDTIAKCLGLTIQLRRVRRIEAVRGIRAL